MPWQNKVREDEVIVLALNTLIRKAPAFDTEDEMIRWLEVQNARSESEKIAEVDLAIKDARATLENSL